jgi:hypothetical protein
MIWLLFLAASVAVVFNGYGAIGTTGVVYLAIASLLALFGGAGLRASLYSTRGVRTAGSLMGAIFLLIGLWATRGLLVDLAGYQISGWQWVLTIFVASFALTTKASLAAS